MHETAAMQRMIRTVLACMQQAGASRVTHVQVALGVSEHVTAEAAHQLFAMLVRGTPIEGASLAIQWLPVRYQCLSCQRSFESAEPGASALCPHCGEVVLEVEHQQTCAVCSIDVSFPVTPETTDLPRHGQQLSLASLRASECSLEHQKEAVR